MNKLQSSFVVMGLSISCMAHAEMMSPAQSNLVDVAKINADIRYTKTRSDAFMGCYVCPEVACCLNEVQEEMMARGYCLVIDEAYVPYSVHKSMVENDSCISCKEECLNHSRGIAVDVSIEMIDGTPLRMPTAFDVFTQEANPDYMELPIEVIEHREMLRDAMERHGFMASENMWYHFECIECKSGDYLDVPVKDLAA